MLDVETAAARPRRRSQRKWSPACAIALCVCAGTLLPAAIGGLTGIPDPLLHDEESYLLGADTFASGRLTNPPLPLPEFFETPHVIVTPTYQSKYPPGQAVVLALGSVLFGQPIWGVWISCGVFAGALCWMLQAWVPRRWALIVTAAAMATLGASTYWAQSYWGGMVAATGGALVFGGMRRTLRSPSVRSGVLFGVGLIILAATRPFDGILALLPATAVLGRWLLRDASTSFRLKCTRFLLPAMAVGLVGLAALAGYNRALTGQARRAAYQVHLDQYFQQGIFLFSPLREPERKPTERVAALYRFYAEPPPPLPLLLLKVAANVAIRLPMTVASGFGLLMAPSQTAPRYLGITLWVALLVPFMARKPVPAFFTALLAGTFVEIIAWLYFPRYPWPLAPFFLAGWLVAFDRTGRRGRWAGFIVVTLAVVALGQAFVPWWSSHYAAPVVPLVFAGIATTLYRARFHSRCASRRLGAAVAVMLLVHGAAIVLLTIFATRSDAHAQGVDALPAALRSRADVLRHFTAVGGRHLVFVSYDADYTIHREWVYNAADIAAQPVMLAHDLGRDRNPKLIARYPDRTVWALHVTRTTAKLTAYQPP